MGNQMMSLRIGHGKVIIRKFEPKREHLQVALIESIKLEREGYEHQY